MMPHKGGREVLRGACALALGNEPLAGGVEYAALECRGEPPKLGVALHHSINGEIGNSLLCFGRDVSRSCSKI